MNGSRTARWLVPLALLTAHPGTGAAGQRRVTPEGAVAAAQAGAPALAIARADSAAARAEVGLARALPNPTLAADYTQDPPTHHIDLEQPLDYPWARSARILAATIGAEAAGLAAAAE